VARREGEIVGALIAAWDGWRGNMYRLAVRDSHRREGIGTALTRAGEDYLRSCGARRVTALVAFEDERAGEFWDSAGYPPGSRDRPTGSQHLDAYDARATMIAEVGRAPIMFVPG